MTEPTPQELAVERGGPVLWLTMQREARRNAMSHAMPAALGQAIARAQGERSLRACALAGAGRQAFVAGEAWVGCRSAPAAPPAG